MGNTPMCLNWKDIFSTEDNEAPVPEIVVVSNDDQGLANANNLTDHEIQVKIQRILSMLNSGIPENLPDKGEKLRANLLQFQADLHRRKLRARKAPEVFESAIQSATTELSGLDIENNFSPCAASKPQQSSFVSPLSKKIEERADPASNGGWRSSSRDTCSNSRRKERGKQIKISSQLGTVSSKSSPFQCASTLHDKDNECRVARPPQSHFARSSFPNSSVKRRKASDSSHALDGRLRKVQDVVLLDDDAEPSQLMIGDTPDDWKEARIYYPSRDDPECIELSYADIKCLGHQRYLTSPIMNFYIRYLQKPLSPIGRKRGEYYFFNTFFYKKLEEAVSCKSTSSARFLKLRRWWKGVNIFQKAYIFVPIHGNMHWSLVIICIPAKEDESGPIVLHLDSLGMHSSDMILGVICNYLKEEWNCISNNGLPPDLPISERIWSNLPCRIERKSLMVPQQKNEYDCGLFVLYFMERFMHQAPERLKRKDLAMFGSKWFQPEEASSLRKRIHDLLHEEFESGRLNTSADLDSPTSSCSSSAESGVQQFFEV